MNDYKIKITCNGVNMVGVLNNGIGIPLYKKLQAKANESLNNFFSLRYSIDNQKNYEFKIPVEEACRLNTLYGVFTDDNVETVNMKCIHQFLCFDIVEPIVYLAFDEQAFMKFWEENGCKKELKVSDKINFNTIPIR